MVGAENLAKVELKSGVQYNDPKYTRLVQSIVVSFMLVLQPHVHFLGGAVK